RTARQSRGAQHLPGRLRHGSAERARRLLQLRASAQHNLRLTAGAGSAGSHAGLRHIALLPLRPWRHDGLRHHGARPAGMRLPAMGVSLGPLPTALLALPVGILVTIGFVLATDRLVYRHCRTRKVNSLTLVMVSLGVMFVMNGLVR